LLTSKNPVSSFLIFYPIHGFPVFATNGTKFLSWSLNLLLIKIYLVGVFKVILLLNQVILKLLLIVFGEMTLQSSLTGMVLKALVLILASEKTKKSQPKTFKQDPRP
jgi:hypothetical protein